MTTALIWLLTPVLILDCLVLGLLVLIQLPKKEAGVGVAFGGGATDALFGAGSGNALTKITKYTAGLFFGLVFILNILTIRAKPGSQFQNELQKPAPVEQAPAPVTATQPALPLATPPSNGSLVPTFQLSNAPATAVPPASNAAAN